MHRKPVRRLPPMCQLYCSTMREEWRKNRATNTAPECVKRKKTGDPVVKQKIRSSKRLKSFSYSALIAPVGQADSQAPQSTQESALISIWSAPIEIAPTGHSLSQAPQLTHSSVITCAILVSSFFFRCPADTSGRNTGF